MPFSEEHKKYHSLSPKDVFKPEGKVITTYDLARNTSMSGEQIHMQCPIYACDTREEVNNRVQFCHSLIQDRLDEENKEILRLNEQALRRQRYSETLKRNEKKFEIEVRDMKKEAKKAGWNPETLDAKIEERKTALKQAADLLYNELCDEDKEFFDAQGAQNIPTGHQLESVPQH